MYVNEYLRHWIKEEWLARGHTAKELAKRCKVSDAAISDFKSSNRGAGYDLANGIAAVIGKSRDEMERDARVWWEGQGRSVDSKNDPHPNRTAALEFLRPEVPNEVLERVRTINLDAPGDPSRAWWVARVMSEMDLHRVKKG